MKHKPRPCPQRQDRDWTWWHCCWRRAIRCGGRCCGCWPRKVRSRRDSGGTNQSGATFHVQTSAIAARGGHGGDVGGHGWATGVNCFTQSRRAACATASTAKRLITAFACCGCGDQKRQRKRFFVAGVSLNHSPIRKPSTQKISPSAVVAKTSARRRVAGILAFTNKSCNFTADFRPIG